MIYSLLMKILSRMMMKIEVKEEELSKKKNSMNIMLIIRKT